MRSFRSENSKKKRITIDVADLLCESFIIIGHFQHYTLYYTLYGVHWALCTDLITINYVFNNFNSQFLTNNKNNEQFYKFSNTDWDYKR